MMNRRKSMIAVASLALVCLLVASQSGCSRSEADVTPPRVGLATNAAGETAPVKAPVKAIEESGPAALSAKPPQTAKPSRTLPQTFDDIKFDIEPDAAFDRAMLTESIEELNGQRIEIRGYILPSFRNKLRDFVLVRDNQECCFGPGAALYDCILVDMTPGKVADFSTRPVTVEGVFRIEPFDIGGTTRAVFRLTADDVD